jgi:hypothetical protein
MGRIKASRGGDGDVTARREGLNLVSASYGICHASNKCLSSRYDRF